MEVYALYDETDLIWDDKVHFMIYETSNRCSIIKWRSTLKLLKYKIKDVLIKYIGQEKFDALQHSDKIQLEILYVREESSTFKLAISSQYLSAIAEEKAVNMTVSFGVETLSINLSDGDIQLRPITDEVEENGIATATGNHIQNLVKWWNTLYELYEADLKIELTGEAVEISELD